jgi:hypothetical protein
MDVLHIAVSALLDVEYSASVDLQFVGVPGSVICILIPPGFAPFGAVPGPLRIGYAINAQVSFAPTDHDQLASFTTAIELVTV